MNIQSVQITFKKSIAINLKNIYVQHEYEVKQENFDLTVNQLSEVLYEKCVDDFFKYVRLGKFGTLYKMPTCILSMAQKYVFEKPLHPRFVP